MRKRKFKPGDWVKLKGKSDTPKMEVIKYVPKKQPLFGCGHPNTYLECVFYKNGERFSPILHQSRLLKLNHTGGIFKT